MQHCGYVSKVRSKARVWSSHRVKVQQQVCNSACREPSFHACTKHIEIDGHDMREKVLIGKIELVCVDTKSQLADILTRSLARPKLLFISKLGMKKHGAEREFVDLATP